MTTKIIIDLDTIDQTIINAIYTYSDLKAKIKDGEERLMTWKNDIQYLLSSTNFKYVEDEDEENKCLPSKFFYITSLKELSTWVYVNKDNSEIKDYEELRGIMKRMYATYSPSGIAHVIRCNFKDQKFLISDMILTLVKINEIVILHEQHSNGYDPFVEFFFLNIYSILNAVEKNVKDC
jgi:hypothetical protein